MNFWKDNLGSSVESVLCFSNHHRSSLNQESLIHVSLQMFSGWWQEIRYISRVKVFPETTAQIFWTIFSQLLFLLNCIVSWESESGQFGNLWLASDRVVLFGQHCGSFLRFIILVQERLATLSMELWIQILEWYLFEPKRLPIKDEFFIIYLPLGFF